MLGLKLPTDPVWAALAEGNLENILTDHAYCEQKAATQCITLITKYPEKTELVEKVAPLVTEEWGHFRLVLQELKKRNLRLGPQRKDEYVNKLLAFQRKGVEEHLFLDRILTSALIEARSCERFKLLSEKVKEEALQQFYHDLMVAEAGHYRLFIDLAKLYVDEQKVKNRWQEFLDYEVQVMKALELRGDRVH